MTHMTRHLVIAQREIREFIADRSFDLGIAPEQTKTFAKLREALALIGEAKFIRDQIDAGRAATTVEGE
jgi:hypothetical protein